MANPTTTTMAGYEIGGTLKSHARSNKTMLRDANAALITRGSSVRIKPKRPPSQRRRCDSAVCALTGASERGHGRIQIRRDDGVGVDDDDAVDLLIAERMLEAGLERVALAAVLIVLALEHFGAGVARALRGVVAAVVGDHEHAPLVGRVVGG